jgi:putative DNA primase/helicase
MHLALALARRGVPVFPCSSDKAPLTRNGFHDAGIDPQIICGWWADWPRALIGVPTGMRFVVVDADLQHASAREWLATADLPETRTHHTRSGGRHFLFQPHPAVRCTTGKIWPHVDTRGLGGYAVFWPSEGLAVEHPTLLAPVPDAIIRALQPLAPKNLAPARGFKPTTGKIAGIVRVVARAPEGQRNRLTFWGACRLAELVAAGALSDSDAVALIVEAASRAGLPHAESHRTAMSALRGAA